MSTTNLRDSNSDTTVLVGATYNQILGLFSKLRSWLDETPNILEMVTNFVEHVEDYQDYSEYIAEKYGNEMVTWVNNFDVAISTSNSDVVKLIESENITTDTVYCKLWQILRRITLVYIGDKEVTTEIPTFYYVGGEQVDAGYISLTDAIAVIGSNREVIESCLTCLDELIKNAEGGIDDLKDFFTLIKTMVSDTAFNSIVATMTHVRQSIGNGLNLSTVSYYFYSILDRFGFPSANKTTEDKTLTYNGTTPAAAWLNAIICQFNNIPNAIAQISYWTSSVISTFFKLLYKGVAWVLYKLWNKVLIAPLFNTTLKVLGTNGALSTIRKDGDGTVENGFHIIRFPINAAIQPEFTPDEVQFIADNIGNKVSHIITIPLVGSRFEYQVTEDGDYVDLRIYNRVLSFEKVANLFSKHNMYLPITNTTTPFGIQFDTSQDPGYTRQQWADLLEDLRSADLSYEEPSFQHNFNYYRGIVIARYLTLIELCCYWYNFRHQDFIHQYGDIYHMVNQYMIDYCDVLGLNGQTSSVWTNRTLYLFLTNGIGTSNNTWGSFDPATGYDFHAMNTWYSNPDRDVLTLFLYPLTIACDIYSFSMDFPNMWLTYLERSQIMLNQYRLLADEEISSAALTSTLKAIGQIAAIVITVIAIKYVPAFLQYKRKLAARTDYLAFAVGENPDDATLYNEYRKTRLKNVILSKVFSSSSAVAVSQVSALSPLSSGDLNFDDEEILTSINELKSCIK